MKLSEKELRKLLNKAWDAAKGIDLSWFRTERAIRNARYRDVTKILKEVKDDG